MEGGKIWDDSHWAWSLRMIEFGRRMESISLPISRWISFESLLLRFPFWHIDETSHFSVVVVGGSQSTSGLMIGWKKDGVPRNVETRIRPSAVCNWPRLVRQITSPWTDAIIAHVSNTCTYVQHLDIVSTNVHPRSRSSVEIDSLCISTSTSSRSSSLPPLLWTQKKKKKKFSFHRFRSPSSTVSFRSTLGAYSWTDFQLTLRLSFDFHPSPSQNLISRISFKKTTEEEKEEEENLLTALA